MTGHRTGVLVFLILGSLLVVASKMYLKPFKSPSSYVYFVSPSRQLEHFTFGYRELVADMMWLRAIQDLDQCDQKLAEGENCNNSWAYKMVDKITDLSPRFRIIYATVPVMLSVTVNDQKGAIQLLEKGIKNFPNDWPILYKGGYLFLFEQGDKLKAAEYFLRAQQNGAPDWIASLATKLYSEAGRRELAEQLVAEYEEKGFDSSILERMKNHLDEANQKIK
ncbi:MAG: hypothetical protein RJB66_145 [Pseudomonadota bacterium]|jgi:tetratricopeptide (TPR) repeat protein